MSSVKSISLWNVWWIDSTGKNENEWEKNKFYLLFTMNHFGHINTMSLSSDTTYTYEKQLLLLYSINDLFIIFYMQDVAINLRFFFSLFVVICVFVCHSEYRAAAVQIKMFCMIFHAYCNIIIIFNWLLNAGIFCHCYCFTYKISIASNKIVRLSESQSILNAIFVFYLHFSLHTFFVHKIQWWSYINAYKCTVHTIHLHISHYIFLFS